MLQETIINLKKADLLLNNGTHNMENYYFNRIRDISSDLELLIEEMEAHV